MYLRRIFKAEVVSYNLKWGRGTFDVGAGFTTLLLRQEVVIVSFASPIDKLLTAGRGGVVVPARETCATQSHLLRHQAVHCWHTLSLEPSACDGAVVTYLLKYLI